MRFVDVVGAQTEDASQHSIEADLLYNARHRNAVLAPVMNVERQHGHRSSQGDDNDRYAVVKTYSNATPIRSARHVTTAKYFAACTFTPVLMTRRLAVIFTDHVSGQGTAQRSVRFMCRHSNF